MHSGMWETEAFLSAQKSNAYFYGIYISIWIAPLRWSTLITPSLSYNELFVNLWGIFFFLIEMEIPFLQV